MTTRRATSRRTSLEKHQDEVIALLLTGTRPIDVAAKYKVARSSVTKFINRHADRLEALNAEVAKQIEDFAIAHKVNRVASKELRWQLLEQVRQARARGEHGMETGLVVRTFKSIGSGRNMQVVEEFKVDNELLAAMDRLEHSAAEELGELTQKVELKAMMLVREIEGGSSSVG